MQSLYCGLLQFIDRMVGGEQEEQRPVGVKHPGEGEDLQEAGGRGYVCGEVHHFDHHHHHSPIDLSRGKAWVDEGAMGFSI